jgi:hypothetical protein
MYEREDSDPRRRSISDGRNHPVFGDPTPNTPIPRRDHGTAIRMACLIGLLIGIFGGIAWFFQVVLRVPAHAAPRSLAASVPPGPGVAAGDEAEGERPDTVLPEPGVCAVSYPAPERLAEIVGRLRKKPGPTPEATEFTGTIDLQLRHELSYGRLIVALDDRTVLSRPLTFAPAGPEPIAHRLSVPAGRHDVRVELTGENGEVFAGDSVITRIYPDRIAHLNAEHTAGTPHRLELKLSTADEAGTRASQ